MDFVMGRNGGKTHNCETCRFWSEMIAMSLGGGPVQAMCLSPEGPNRSRYTIGSKSCDGWKSGHYGAVDEPSEPGDEVWRLYEEEEKKKGDG